MKSISSPSLNLQSFQKALASLEEVIFEFNKDTENKFIRDACIQRFEYTYELSGKMLRRYLELTETTPSEITEMSFPNLIRTGSKRGLLLKDWEQWFIYRNARNLTSHTYDEKKADQVIKIIPAFFEDAKYLFTKINSNIKKL